MLHANASLARVACDNAMKYNRKNIHKDATRILISYNIDFVKGADHILIEGNKLTNAKMAAKYIVSKINILRNNNWLNS